MEVKAILSVDEVLRDYEALLKDKEERVSVPAPAELREKAEEGQKGVWWEER